MRIYRWDLDKTYLETDFDSWRGLMRSATEPATAKKAVPGAPALIRALSSEPDNRLYFVSGSPTQMREVLAEKLRLDGVRYERLTLKDNLSNLRRGRVRAIKGQFGYKLPQLLRDRAEAPRGSKETLFGDDAEVDALVYCAYADAVSGRLEPVELARVMRAAGAYPDDVEAALAALSELAPAPLRERIFIRLERRRPLRRFEALGSRVVPVHSWWQAALVLVGDGELPPEAAAEVALSVFDDDPHPSWAVAAQAQDAVRRGVVAVDELASVPLPAAWRAQAIQAARSVPARPLQRRRGPPGDHPDYKSLVQNWSVAAEAADGGAP